MLRWLFLFIIIAIIEVYSFQAIRTISKSKVVNVVYLVVSILAIAFIFYQFSKFDRSVGQTQMSLFTLGLLLLLLIPKIILTVFMLLEDVFRIFSGTITHFVGDNDSGSFLADRRKFISQMALVIAAIPFTSLLYGMTKGKYDYRVINDTVEHAVEQIFEVIGV